ncbi:amino acid adenylation domain-containing protein [Vibrio sp. S4M6]|uniref:non-ribosomal peptide synthetase n=1 Tax=Vibrio sinus TaxID=2946865 RepID=UPI002029D59F|nr:non-ribosomal peptide synthetase [Vibrio sinus]MCL9782400.1 amino acid adenylation domain-containing protein [Vibrio sinus]
MTLLNQKTNDCFPLHTAQENVWIDQAIFPTNPKYNICVYQKLSCNIDYEKFSQAWRSLVNQYDSLRIELVFSDDEIPMQRVLPADSFESVVGRMDFSLSEDPAQMAMDWMHEQSKMPIDVAHGDRYYIYILQLGKENNLVFSKTHHLFNDGVGTILMHDYLLNNYKLLVDGAELEGVKSPAYQLAANRSNNYLQTSRYARDKEYWTGFASQHEVTRLPLVNPRATGGSKLSMSFSKDEVSALRKFCEEEKLGLMALLLSAVNLYFFKTLGTKDVVVGTAVHGRHGKDEMQNLGMHSNAILLSTIMSNDLSYQNLIKSSLSSLKAAMKRAQFPKSHRARLSGSAMNANADINVLYDVYSDCNGGLSQASSEVQYMLGDVGEEPLSLRLIDFQNSMKLAASFQYAYFSEQEMQLMLARIKQILLASAASFNKTLDTIDVLLESEKTFLLDTCNNTDSEYPCDKTLHQLFEEQVEKTPLSIALTNSETTLTYRELNQKANQLAVHLRQRYQQKFDKPFQAGTYIALYLDRSIDIVVSQLAVLKAGGAYVPVSPQYPNERIQFMLEDTDASLVLTQQEYSLNLAHCLSENSQPRELVIVRDVLEKNTGEPNLEPVSTSSQDLAYVIYTSGTTGNPKGVMIPHQGVVSLVQGNDYVDISPQDTFLQLSNPNFDAATFEIWGALLNGAKLHIPLSENHLDSGFLKETIVENEVTILWLTRALFDSLYLEKPDMFSSLRYLLVGGEKLTAPLIRELVSSDWSPEYVINGYGPTESTTFTTTFQCNGEAWNVPIGKPINTRKAYVLSNDLSLAPIGIPGELYIGGAGLAHGYLNNIELTQDRFIENPYASESDIKNGYTRLYKSGDIVRYLPDGNLEYLTRNDGQVKIRGYRIELGEVESALLQLSDVKNVVVIDHVKAGHKFLAAYIVLTDVGEINQHEVAERLREQLSHNLPDYMVPASYTLLNELPLTINGKLDRRALPEPEFVTKNRYEAPRNSTEMALCQIWQDVLGLEKVGINDNFFRIGGDSISAIRLSAQVRRQLNKEVTLSALFTSPTIAGLASELSDDLHVIPSLKKKSYPASFAQERLWFIESFENGCDSYHIPYFVKLHVDTEDTLLLEAINLIVSRHPILSSCYQQTMQGDVYMEHSISALSYQCLTVPDRRSLAQQVQLDMSSQFDLATELPMRLHRYDCNGERYLLLMWHHIVFDGWSTDIFLSELSEIYRSLTQNQRPNLPDININFGDYAQWQREHLKGDTLEAMLGYWKQQLSGYESLNLLCDYPRPSSVDYRGANLSFTLDDSVSENVRCFAKQEGVTTYSVLLSGFYVLLSTLSGQQDITIGTPSDNRQHAQTQDLIGFFVNSLALRTHVTPSQSFAELVRQVHQMVSEAKAHQELPFEKLVSELGVERDMSRHPIFQVMFSLQRFGQELQGDDLPFSLDKLEEAEYTSAKFDLSLFMDDSSNNIQGEWNYSTCLWKTETILRYSAMFEKLMCTLTRQPTQHIHEIETVAEDERNILLNDWSNTRTELRQDKTVCEIFEQQVRKTPDHTALIFADKTLTYNELNDRVNQLAHYIRERHLHLHNTELKADTFIALYFDSSIEMVVSMLAVLKAGGAYVPVSPDYPQDRIHHMFKDTSASMVLTEVRLSPKLDECLGKLCQPVDKVVTDGTPSIGLQRVSNPVPMNCTQDLAYVIYTSGTTGMPKGVMIPHQGITSLMVNNSYIELSQKDVLLQLSNPSFDAATFEIWGALLNGASLCIPENKQQVSAESLHDTLSTYNVSVLWLTRALFDSLYVEQPDLFSQLHYLIVGGEKLTSTLMKELVTSPWSPKHVLNGYGPTESTTFTTTFKCDGRDAEVPIGKPIDTRTAYVLTDKLSLAPIGVPGELYVGGSGLARGYLNQPTLTQERFIANPFATNQGEMSAQLYRTGDIVRWLPDGNLEYLGRNDMQVKIRGYRIELGEVETALLQNEHVKQVAVIDLEREGYRYLAAYVVLEQSAMKHQTDLPVVDIESLRSQLSKTLPDYMIPTTFTLLEALPLTNNGKLNRRQLPEPEFISQERYVAPKTELEQKICQIWQSTLGIEQVGVEDDFFHIGGNSILAIRLVKRMNNIDGFNIDLTTVFSCKTIANICSSIKDKSEYKYLTPLTLGSKSEQTIYMIHSASSDSEVYQGLSEELGSTFNCVGINNYNFVEEQVSSSLAEVSQAYFKEILQYHKQNQPVKLLGWSLGGYIALNLACLLEERGFTDIEVYLLDTYIGNCASGVLSDYDSYETIKNRLVNKGCDADYIAKALAAYSCGREMTHQQLVGDLKYTQITLFKAGMGLSPDHAMSSFDLNRTNAYMANIHDNNLSTIVEQDVEVVRFDDIYHSNILERSSDIARVVMH